MITIDLEDNDDCILLDSESETPKEPEIDFNFKRKLILQVQKHPSLYDNKHRFFSNVAKKDLVWKQIAEKLKSDVNDCKDTWLELRYDYQRYARNLRNYFISGHKVNRKRPAMALESELMFLWRFVDSRKSCKIPFEIEDDDKNTEAESQCNNESENMKQIDDDLILVEDPVELIVIDEDDDNDRCDKQFNLNVTMKTLILQIKNYPELYDTKHASFKDYARKSFIWNAIASTMGDKATKLMKCWIVMQTRYEWEISQTKQNTDKGTVSELQKNLDFFKDYILDNPDTVYKQSHYLKTEWHDPIDYFKDIYNLIVRMKKLSNIVYVTDSLLKTPGKSKQYISLWTDVSSLKNTSAGQCETTWLIMRFFYWELMYMRLQNYQLTDKWYFETIITELYAISKTAHASKQHEFELLKQNKASKKSNKRSAQSKGTSQGEPPNKRSSPILPIPASAPAPPPITTAAQMTATIINNLQNVPSTNSTQSTYSTQFTLPKITAAISLAPQALNTGSLQIKQIPGPPTLSPAPQPLNMLNGTGTAVVTPANPNQMSVSFNLPSQTIVTPIQMPSLLRPVTPASIQPIRNTTQATISVRPRTITRAPLSNVQVAPWSSASLPSAPVPTANTSMKSFVTTPLMANMQNTPPAYGSGNSTATPCTTSIKPIAAHKITVPININDGTAAAITNNMPTTSTATNANTSQLPKITGAMSLLNRNEILIELISSHNGNQLVVHGPALNNKYQLSMSMVSEFIREILAIPLLHNKSTNQPGVINSYWEHISTKFHLPLHICRACWNFLVGNFSHFPQIAPLKELMKPFQTSLNVWTESHELFSKFDDECVAKGWLEYAQILPDVIVAISGYPVLYQDARPQKGDKKVSEMEIVCAWRTIKLRFFPKIRDMRGIWNAFKFCFIHYMKDLEFGIVNKWPMNWWRTLARMKFLVETRYSQNEPYYYIVTNKMLEEIDKCAMTEMKKRYKIDDGAVINVKETVNTEQADENKIKDMVASVMDSNAKRNKEVEIGALMAVIQKYPIIYGKADNMEKYEAWKKVAKELHMEVPECLFAFKHATEKYFTYKKQDPLNRCRLNEKYYKKFDEMVRSVSNGKYSTCLSKINIKTPFELNQSVDADNPTNDTQLVFPERYISDICVWNSKTSLVVKNWVHAIGNIPVLALDFNIKFKDILKKYVPNIE